MINFIFSIYFLTFFLIVAIPYLGITFLLFLYGIMFDKKLKGVHAFSYFIAMSFFWISPGWKIKISGKENIDKDKSYLIISNHQAMLDIALLYAVPLLFKFVSKKEVYKIPFFGWLLYLHQDITIDRGNPSSAKKMIKDSITCLDNGISVLIFPEGTRSGGGDIATFKDGAFLTAKMAKRDILPLVINGTGLAMNVKGGILRAKQTFHLEILPPIPFDQYKDEKIPLVTKKVFETMTQRYQTIR